MQAVQRPSRLQSAVLLLCMTEARRLLRKMPPRTPFFCGVVVVVVTECRRSAVAVAAASPGEVSLVALT